MRKRIAHLTAAAAGLLGINGLTARLALMDIGRLKPGETVLVTAGAGAVGSIAGQLAGIAGCRAVAVVGSDEKGRQCLDEFGYAAYVNYRQSWAEELSRACPGGIDVLFDNIQVFDRAGRILLAVGEGGEGPGQFWLPNGIAISRSDEIFVADSYNHRVQILKYVGNP